MNPHLILQSLFPETYSNKSIVGILLRSTFHGRLYPSPYWKNIVGYNGVPLNACKDFTYRFYFVVSDKEDKLNRFTIIMIKQQKMFLTKLEDLIQIEDI